MADSTIGWVNKPNLDERRRLFHDVLDYRTNRDGLVPFDARREKEPGRLRIMVFGDSMVVGRAVPQELIYTARLEALLNEAGIPAEVVNAGVQGYSTDQALLWMERLLPLYHPDIVLYGSTHNDFGGNSSREASRQSKPSFALVGGRLRLQLPQGNELRRSSGLRFWLQYSAAYRAIAPKVFELRARLHGWQEQSLYGLRQQVYVDPEAIEVIDWPLYGALLQRMQRAAEKVGARFLFFAHPELPEVWAPYIEATRGGLGHPRAVYDRYVYERRIGEVARALGITFVPSIDYFRERQERGPFHLLPFDAHLSPAGHALMAELLAREIRTVTAPPAPGLEGSL
jgi:lysophospholipase L1-like esterase